MSDEKREAAEKRAAALREHALRTGEIDALLVERDAYITRGDSVGVAAVEEQLALRGHVVAVPRPARRAMVGEAGPEAAVPARKATPKSEA